MIALLRKSDREQWIWLRCVLYNFDTDKNNKLNKKRLVIAIAAATTERRRYLVFLYCHMPSLSPSWSCQRDAIVRSFFSPFFFVCFRLFSSPGQLTRSFYTIYPLQVTSRVHTDVYPSPPARYTPSFLPRRWFCIVVVVWTLTSAPTDKKTQ